MKTLICMRGLPGSGKSTKAKELTKRLDGVVFSTDDLFVINGVYTFNPLLLGWYHQRTSEAVMLELKTGERQHVILDNTNLTRRDIADCARMVYSLPGVQFRVEYADTPWRNHPVECYARCTHNVPLYAIERLYYLKYWRPDETLSLSDFPPPPP